MTLTAPSDVADIQRQSSLRDSRQRWHQGVASPIAQRHHIHWWEGQGMGAGSAADANHGGSFRSTTALDTKARARPEAGDREGSPVSRVRGSCVWRNAGDQCVELCRPVCVFMALQRLISSLQIFWYLLLIGAG